MRTHLGALTIVALLALNLSGGVTPASAVIVFDSLPGPTLSNFNTGSAVNASYTPTAGTDSVLILAVAADHNFANLGATFGGSAMTLGATNGRTAVFYMLNPGSSPGSLNLTLGGNGAAPELITYGTLLNVNTAIAPKTSTGATQAGATLNAGNALTGLSDTDYVLATFFANGASTFKNSSSRTFSSPLLELNGFSNNTDGDYSGSIGGGIVGVSGNYSPSVTFNGGSHGGTSNQVNGSFIAFAALPDVGASAIPEPSTCVLGLLGLAGLIRRRRMA